MVKFTEFDEECYLFAVFDGHFGADASYYCFEHFHEQFAANMNLIKDPIKALEATFSSMEELYLKEAVRKQTEAGTTAVVAVIYGTRLIVGNVGDSEAVLSRNSNAVVLTEIHTLRNSKEVKRVKQAGGSIYGGTRLCHSVWNPSVINLGVTRAIGDVYFKLDKYTEGKATGLICSPTIRETIISSCDDILLMGSDGLWQSVAYQEAIEFVSVHLKEFTPDMVCKKLVEYALSKKDNDNITAIIIGF